MTDRQTNGLTDICDCRVAFATENMLHNVFGYYLIESTRYILYHR